MAESRSRLSSFTVVLAGMMLVLGGMGALGIWLAAAAKCTYWYALGARLATVVFLTTGFVLLILAYRHRGGLLEQKPTASGIQTYREDYRD